MFATLKEKISSFFQPLQFGMAFRAGAEKIVHSLGNCSEEHWLEDDFFIFKVDMANAFNLVSRQAILDECSVLFPKILSYVSWCYGSHPELWHPMGHLSSQTSVQQRDPLGLIFLNARCSANRATICSTSSEVIYLT